MGQELMYFDIGEHIRDQGIAGTIEEVLKTVKQHKPAIAHYAHLTVHGVLHLLGWDHDDDKEAEAMEQLERDILAELGLPDPYAEE